MKFLRRSLVGLFLLSVTVALLALAGQTIVAAVEERLNAEPQSFPSRERVLTVNVVPYEPGTVTPVLQVFGELRSQRTLDMRASVGGRIVEVADTFVDGGRVRAGDVLVRIDPTDAESALARSRADLQDAEAELRDAERAIVLARDELSAAEEQVTLRERALERQQDLADRGVATAAALEEAELAVSSARASVLSRRQAVATAEARIDQAATRLARIEIDMAEAERALADTEIEAAFDGVLSEVSVVEGGRVAANELLARLIDPDRLEVSFRVSTAQYARLLDEEGDLRPAPVTATLDVSGVDLTATGRLSRVSAAVPEGQTGRLIFARLDEAPGFRPGDFVTVAVEEPPLDAVARLPATAVASDGTVLVVGAEERLDLRPVEVLRRQGDEVILRGEGLAGDLVVAERSPLLGLGIKVRPLLPGGADAAPEAPETVQLDPDRRARLVAFVQGSPMPDEAKTRILSQLEGEDVPAEIVARLESRMGS
ncbi:efflux RND transporter periplasmic adaptor subunit [Histidinibacterium lentulum]|uniref:HlyD family efflux transporter periplasmic adaptor subunit n=1 Tax=Histidinibacterium lentulum TaxID=2480588 RepID=A0A3N2R4Z9_9RHOB|nr:HlyD family efflux transporter periplasmic adaptor subunit [Histidinibacterium lentulum]ROU02570.1 HlyD family efflux transporter periplasmic adaptor subunit [Histidinibacterium lentulum]